jgi:hypothetical protein
VVEGTCQILVLRLPALVAWGTRVQAMPDALATSIAATRSTISSRSSTSTCWPAGTDRLLSSRVAGGLPGARLGYRNSDRRARGNSARPCYRAPAPDSGTASSGQGHIGVGGQPDPFSRQHGVPQGDTSTQVKIADHSGKLPGTHHGRRGPRPSAEQWTAQRPSCVAHLRPSGVAAGHEPLTMDGGQAPCCPASSQVARNRACRRYGLCSVRAEVFHMNSARFAWKSALREPAGGS